MTVAGWERSLGSTLKSLRQSHLSNSGYESLKGCLRQCQNPRTFVIHATMVGSRNGTVCWEKKRVRVCLMSWRDDLFAETFHRVSWSFPKRAIALPEGEDPRREVGSFGKSSDAKTLRKSE